MKVIVLGSGVIGVSCAYQLAEAGHEVTVVDRQPEAGLETSHANAGEVSPGYSSPWAGPGVPLKAIKWLLMHHRPLVIRPQLDLEFVRWGLAMLRNCTAARYEVNKSRMVRLAEYSRDCLRELRAQTGIRYDERMQGTLQLFRTQHQLDATAADIAILKRYGVAHELLDMDGCIRHEPALARTREKFSGGLQLPGDETGDCFLFTQALASLAAQRGVTFRYGVAIERLSQAGGRIDGVATDAGVLKADAYLLALGSYSPLLLAPLGIRIPVYPVKGYSITVPITDPAGAPESTVMDETHKVAVTRLGDRIRVGGTAELAGYTLKLCAEEFLGLCEDHHRCRHHRLGRDAEGRRQGLCRRRAGGRKVSDRPGPHPRGLSLAGDSSRRLLSRRPDQDGDLVGYRSGAVGHHRQGL